MSTNNTSTQYVFKNPAQLGALFMQHALAAQEASEKTKQLKDKYTLAREASTWRLAAGIVANTTFDPGVSDAIPQS